jgi:hypothetical protein
LAQRLNLMTTMKDAEQSPRTPCFVELGDADALRAVTGGAGRPAAWRPTKVEMAAAQEASDTIRFCYALGYRPQNDLVKTTILDAFKSARMQAASGAKK